MASLTDISKRSMKGAGGSELNHKLIVAGRNFSHRLIDATITYNTDIGGSGIQFSVYGTELQDYINAPMSFWIGYGEKLVPYFVGKLQLARPAENLNILTAQAFGPYRLLVGQILRSQETFIGNTLEYVVMECFRRAGADLSKVEIRSGRKYRIQEAEQYVYDSGLSDIVTSVLEKANFVGMDVPGGKRLILPTPRPGINVAHKTTYSPDNYYEFSLTPKDEELYYSVMVYRRDENGNDIFRIEQEIDPFSKFTPPRNKVLVVSDFPGDIFEAGEKAFEMAQAYRTGENSFSMTIPINPDLVLYDGFRAVQERILLDEKRREERVYSCTIDGEIVISYSPGEGNMSLGGSAVELVRERVMKEIKNPVPSISTGVIRKSVDHTWNSWDDADVTFEQLTEDWEK